MSSFAAEPQSLAEEINNQLAYSFMTPEVDEFTLRRWSMCLEKILANKGLNPAEYAAYSKVLIAQQRKDDAIKILEEGQKAYPRDFSLHKSAAIAHALMWSGDQYDFDPDTEWFDSPANPDHEPLEIRYSIRHISYCGHEYPIAKAFPVVMKIVRNDICRAISNDIHIDFDSRFNGGQLFLDTLLDAYLLDNLDSQQAEYLNAVVDESTLMAIKGLRKDISAPLLDPGTIEQITLSDGIAIRIPEADVLGAGETSREAYLSALIVLSTADRSSAHPPYDPHVWVNRKTIIDKLQEGSRSIEAAES
jgi:hypothetical protein